jgi:hypothetical protein
MTLTGGLSTMPQSRRTHLKSHHKQNRKNHPKQEQDNKPEPQSQMNYGAELRCTYNHNHKIIIKISTVISHGIGGKDISAKWCDYLKSKLLEEAMTDSHHWIPMANQLMAHQKFKYVETQRCQYHYLVGFLPGIISHLSTKHHMNSRTTY